MILYGTTHCVGDDVTAADIIAPQWRDADDPAILAAHCLEAASPVIAERAQEGDVLLAGRGFGGSLEEGESNYELAALALQAAGFAAIVCVSAEPGFIEAAQVYGLPVLICPAAVAEISAGLVVRLDLANGRIEDRASGSVYTAPPCVPELVQAVRRAQLLNRMRRVVEEEGFDG
jgi:3-isopropylmalate/(R)-2-methylmalate dehydratase small subunit